MDEKPTLEALQAALPALGASPADGGTLELIVCRPAPGERRVVERAELTRAEGVVGDNWRARGSRHTEDGSAHPDMQVAIMNSRVVQLLAQERARWALAGDQLYADLDLSADNLPPGTRLAVGSVVLEITARPHTGCDKFTERFGHGAIRLVNSPEGRQARLRGVYARVVQSGTLSTGDRIRKLSGG